MIAEEVRHWILTGKYLPGMPLPPRPEIEAMFGVCRMTLQRSLDRLIDAGFLTAIPGTGTFVSESLPHLNRLGVLFPWRERRGRPWPIDWQWFRDVCQSYGGPDNAVTVECFYHSEGLMDDRDACVLEDALHEHRIAGLLVMQEASAAIERFSLEKSGLPHAVLSAGFGEASAPSVHLDLSAWLETALGAVVAEGRSRPAMLVSPVGSDHAAVVAAWARLTEAHGLSSSPAWVQAVDPSQPHWTAHTLTMMLGGPDAQRPDALIVTDESLTDAALRGLLEASVQVGRDLTVVTRRDPPTQGASILPVIELGFPMEMVLAEALEAFRRARSGDDSTIVVRPPVQHLNQMTPTLPEME